MRRSHGARSARKAMKRADGIAFERFVSEHNARIAAREEAGVWDEKDSGEHAGQEEYEDAERGGHG